MKTRHQKLLDDQRISEEERQAISRRNAGSSTSVNGGINANLFPIDLIIEILSRLPVKSIARCRCVWKFWSSMLGRTDFTELFLARSTARPKLLLVHVEYNDVLFFSSPQPRNPDENSYPIVADYHMTFPLAICKSFGNLKVYRPVHGLICVKTMRIFEERKCTVLVICNPSTGQSLTLPRVNTKRVEVKSFFGYDPIDKQFKLVSMSRPMFGKNMDCSWEHQVMTLGTMGELLWRMIECGTLHYPSSNGICINGAIYYVAAVKGFEGKSMIASFDIRSENFMFIEKAESVRGELVNYKGKLAMLKLDHSSAAIRFELCVLEDAEKHEWTTHTYVQPPLWKDIVGDVWLNIIGVTRTGEIVLSPSNLRGGIPYFIYYNLERNSITKLEIQGIDVPREHRFYAFLDHVEDVKLGGVFRT